MAGITRDGEMVVKITVYFQISSSMDSLSFVLVYDHDLSICMVVLKVVTTQLI